MGAWSERQLEEIRGDVGKPTMRCQMKTQFSGVCRMRGGGVGRLRRAGTTGLHNARTHNTVARTVHEIITKKC